MPFVKKNVADPPPKDDTEKPKKEKEKRVMTTEALAKLKLAREKALEVRKKNAELKK